MKLPSWLTRIGGIVGLLLLGIGSSRAVTLLDHTFGTGGRVITTAGDNTSDIGYGLTFQPDGKIVVAGQITLGGPRALGAVRYEADGSLDTTFGSGGLVKTPFPGNYDAVAAAVAVQPDGKIVVAGDLQGFVLVRYMPNGSLDTTFNGTGKLLRNPFGPGYVYCSGLAIQPDGKILVSGTFYNGDRAYIGLMRCLANGSLDTSFNGTGKIQVALKESCFGRSLALQSDGKIIVAGVSLDYTADESYATLLRYLPSGTPDTSFNGMGVVLSRLEGRNSYANSVAIQSDGKIVIGGGIGVDGGDSETGELFNMMAARYDSAGNIDTSFNLTGSAMVDFGTHSVVSSVLMQGSRIVLVGTRHDSGADGNNNADFALARFDAAGALDTTFNVSGKALTDFSRGMDSAYAGAVQADGKIVAVGASEYSMDYSKSVTLALARYTEDGASTVEEDDGGGISMRGPPVINHDPVSQVVGLGQNFNLYCSHGGAPPFTYQWFKNGKPITGATASHYSVSMDVSAADAAKYTVRITNDKGSKLSRPAFVAVAGTGNFDVEAVEGRDIVLDAQVIAPPGSPISYRWYCNAEPMVNSPTVKGVTTTKLKLTHLHAADAGNYFCQVGMGALDDSSPSFSSFNLTVVPPPPVPVLDPITLADATVNDAVSLTLTASNNPTHFAAKGLPPGVDLDGNTGVLSGKPKKAKMVRGQPVPYKVTFTASNISGHSEPVAVNWLIQPIPQALSGTFTGLVSRNAALNGSAGNVIIGLGGKIRTTVTDQGVLSGVLTLGRQTFLYTAPLSVTDNGDAGNAVITLKRGKQTPLTLTLTLSRVSGEISGSVTDGSADATLNGWRQTAGVVAGGSYNETLASTNGDNCSATMLVMASGITLTSGRLADGAVVISAGTTGPEGQVSLQQLLYKQTGSLLGVVQISAPDDSSVAGELSLLKGTVTGTDKTVTANSGSIQAQTFTVSGQNAGK